MNASMRLQQIAFTRSFHCLPPHTLRERGRVVVTSIAEADLQTTHRAPLTS